MYEFVISDIMIAECTYCSCTLYPWSVELYLSLDGKWYPYGKIKRFETLDNARNYCIRKRGEKRCQTGSVEQEH